MDVSKKLRYADYVIDVTKEDPLARIMERLRRQGRRCPARSHRQALEGLSQILLGIEALKRKGKA